MMENLVVWFRKIKLVWVIILSFVTIAHADIIDFNQFDKYVTESMADWNVPGAAIAIVKDGKIVYLKGFGVKTVGKNAPVSPATVFPLASVTKTFTVMVVCRLIDEGKLHWDDKVQTYYPEFSL
ncbi:MAG TPA: serine hydrolase domain-containing protein, partial [Candidatus Nitrosotenuis sp.]|nr:serine hydrolase domain-containing protein [Candidatus Nitrosotenuis sp.]